MATLVRSAKPKGTAFTPEKRPLNHSMISTYLRTNEFGSHYNVLGSDIRRNDIKRRKAINPISEEKKLTLEQFMLEKLLEATTND